MIEGTALRKTSKPELAEEIAQAVFALAARRAASLASHPCPAAWLHRTAVLESANALRRELKHRKIAAAVLTHPDTSPESGFPEAVLPLLDDALNSLGENDRRAVLLRFGEKLSFDSMAARLGKSADACQKQTSRALERLRGKLSRNVAGITATGLAAGLGSAMSTPAAAAAGKVSAAAIAAAPHISLTTILHHIIHTMSTGKQIAAGAGLVALLASVPLGMGYSEAASLRSQLATHAATSTPAAGKLSPASPQPAAETAGSRVLPGVSADEADRTLAMLRGLKGKLLTSAQLVEVSTQIMTLPASHLPKALEAMADFPGLLPAGILRVMVFARWGELDPEAAVAALPNSKLDMMTGEVARMAISSGWLERDPLGFTRWLKANAKDPMAGSMASAVQTSMHLFDRETMQELYDVVPSGHYPGALELEYECGLEDGDVAGVAHRLLGKARDDHRRDELIRTAARHIAKKDPKAALEFVMSHPDPRGKIADLALAETIGSWAETDMNAATAWAWEREGNSGDRASTQVWKALAAKDDAEIQAQLAKAPNDNSRLQALEVTAAQAMQGDKAKSLRLIAQLPDEPRQRSMELYGQFHAGQSVVKTSEWLLTLPAGADKDAAIRGFAPVLAKSEPDSAVIWAASLQDEAQRSALVQKLGSQWYQKAPDAARAWLEQNETLTAADRAAITAKP